MKNSNCFWLYLTTFIILAGPIFVNATTFRATNSSEILAHLSTAQGGDTILLAPGRYADITIRHRFSDYVTLQAEDRLNPPMFEVFRVVYSSYVRVDGIALHHIRRATDADWERAFEVMNSNYFQLLKSELYGSVDGNHENDVYGFATSRSSNMLIEGNTFHDWTRGSVIGGGDNIVFRNNRFYDIRSDGADFGGVVNTLVEGNEFINFHPCCGDHPDHIQFWNDNGTRTMENVTIRGNLSRRGAGDYTQSIFIQSNTPAFPNRNFLIENNVVYNTHSHGITIYDTIGVTIRHNTIIKDLNTDGLTPSINTIRTVNAVVADNVATAFSDSGQDTVSIGNIKAQNSDPLLPTHYDRLFVNANSGTGAVLNDFYPRAGSILIVNPGPDIGALEYNPNPAELTALILNDVDTGHAPLTVHFDGTLSGGPDPISRYEWDFGDGTTSSSGQPEHVFSNPGTYNVTLTVTDQNNKVASTQTSITVTAPAVVGLVLGLSFDNHILDSSINQIVCTPSGALTFGAGIQNQALQMDGTPESPNVTAPHHETLDGMTALSFSFWAKKNDADTGGTILNKHVTYSLALRGNSLGGYL